jgi:hypothetical protein
VLELEDAAGDMCQAGADGNGDLLRQYLALGVDPDVADHDKVDGMCIYIYNYMYMYIYTYSYIVKYAYTPWDLTRMWPTMTR